MHLFLFFVATVAYMGLCSCNFADEFTCSQEEKGRVIQTEDIFAYNTNHLKLRGI
jgi:hypothetical protein